ncbi:MAG: hypothetical protein S4CHLAM20_05240 [Chlamydiia bacterium]|nr:hypothetical protein [Chlamydiia bacterium]
MQFATIAQPRENEVILTAERARDNTEGSSLTHVFQNLEANNNFNDYLENIRNANGRLNHANNLISDSKRLNVKRVIAITGLVLSVALVIAAFSLPFILPVSALFAGLSLTVGVWTGVGSTFGFSFWTNSVCYQQSLTCCCAKIRFDAANRELNVAKNNLKNLIRTQNPNRNLEFYKSVFNMCIQRLN